VRCVLRFILVVGSVHCLGLYSRAAKHYESVLELAEKETGNEGVDVCICILYSLLDECFGCSLWVFC
jgi:hypothetical protein